MIGSSRVSQMIVIEDEAMNQNIEQVSHPRDAISKELYDKCMDRLTGADKLAALIDDIMNMPINTNTGSTSTNSFINTKDIEFRFEPEPYKHPAYLDRSYMISIDVTQLP